MGPCAGGAVYSPAITDFNVMVEGTSYMFVTGPDVIKTVTHEEVTKDELGGAMTHNATSGVAHFAVPDDRECLRLIASCCPYLPSNNVDEPPRHRDLRSGRSRGRGARQPGAAVAEPALRHARPDSTRSPDEGAFLEVHRHFAKNIIVGFARLGGRSVGIVANQPAHLAGTLDIDASVKAARFVRFCDAFNIALVTIEDVPGFLPGTVQEFGGIIRHGAKLLYAFAEATVPKLTLITRKAYGGAYCVMSSKHIRTDVNFAWPGAEIAVMGPEGRGQHPLQARARQGRRPAGRPRRARRGVPREVRQPYVAAARGFIDEVIHPRQTRAKLIAALPASRPSATRTRPRSTATSRYRSWLAVTSAEGGNCRIPQGGSP
jgi:propionyl-CoA carboxylase beta chain